MKHLAKSDEEMLDMVSEKTITDKIETKFQTCMNTKLGKMEHWW